MKAESNRPFQVIHQTLSLTGINFNTRSVIGATDLTILPLRDNLKHIRLNAKQAKIYRVTLNNDIEAPFIYFDPTLEVCQDEVLHRDLETYSDAHLHGCNLVDPDLNGGELNIRIPNEAYAADYVAVGKVLKVCIEFSLVEPQGGLHFVVPENPFKHQENKGNEVKEEDKDKDVVGSGGGGDPAEAASSASAANNVSMADRAAHMFSCGYENASRLWFPCVDTLSELCTWKLEFTVDESMTAVSVGDLVEVVYTQDMKRKTFHYVVHTPTPAPNIALAVGPFEVYVDPNMHEVTHFCLPHLLPLLKATARWLHEAFEFFEMTLANRFPHTCYKQVYVDEPFITCANYSTMSILSTSLLHSSAIIDQVYETRTITAHAIANQFYGCFITTEKWSDQWLKKGISKYLAGLFVKKMFGNNEYRDMIHKEMERVVRYEDRYGGIALDSHIPPQTVTPVRGRPERDDRVNVEDNFAFDPSNLNSCSPEWLEVMEYKSHLCVRMLEKAIGAEQLLQVLNKQLSLAVTAAQPGSNPKLWPNMVINTLSFKHSIFMVTGKDMGVFIDKWIRSGGHAQFHMDFFFNRKRNTVEMNITQDAAGVNKKGVRKYVGPLTVAVQELDGWFSYTFAIESLHSKHDITCHSKSRRNKKKKIPLCNNEEVDMDLSAMDDSPVLWIRVDPDMLLIRSLDVQQPDFQWQYQLRHERDVTAQREAVQALERFPGPNTRKALTDMIEKEKCFWRIRCEATHCLAVVANKMASTWEGPPAMLVMFKKMYGSFAAGHMVKQNDFSSLQCYFLQKEIPRAMAKLRNSHGVCPPEVLKFILDLFKYNDNTKNTFSDNYYRAALVDALGDTVTPVVSVHQASSSAVTAESLSTDTKLMLEEVSRYLNLEKLLPSYKYTVTTSCLRAIRKLQKMGHLPSSAVIFKDYAAPGQFIDVRLTALECLADYIRVEGSYKDIFHILNMIEKDPVPFVRHRAARLMVSTPPFDRARNHRNDKPELVERLWGLMNSGFWYDSRLRCDVVDLYYELYGKKKPVSVPLPELAALRPQKVDKPKGEKEKSFVIPKAEKQKSFVIPKAGKRKAEETPEPPPASKQPKTEPQATFQRQFLEAVGGEAQRGVAPAEVPDYFAADPPPATTPVPALPQTVETASTAASPAPATAEAPAPPPPRPPSSSSKGDHHSHHKHHSHKEKKAKKEKKKKHKHKKHKTSGAETKSSGSGDKEKERKKHKKDKKAKEREAPAAAAPSSSSTAAAPAKASEGALSSGSSSAGSSPDRP